MGQTKFENKIKEQLNSREIQPSTQAWDRLDAMLTVAEERKPKRSFGWLYIAAAILVFLSVGLFFFTQKDAGINSDNTVVGNDEPKKEIHSEENEVNGKAGDDTAIISETEFKKASEKSKSEQKSNTSIAESNKGFNLNQKTINQKQSNPLINREKEIEFQNSSDVAQKDLPKVFESKKEINVNGSNKSNAMTDEQLLASLDNSSKKTTTKPTTIQVDAKSLLSQVDGELEMTFREKVINKVSKNYKEIKVALANRNKE